MNKFKLTFILFVLFSLPFSVLGQRTAIRSFVTINLVPDQDDWTYELNEKVNLSVSVVRESVNLKDVVVEYKWGGDNFPESNLKTQKVSIDSRGVTVIELEGRKTPGFKTFEATTVVNNVKYTNYITLGFEPYKIKTTTTMPNDFNEFWDGVLAETSAVPLKSELTLDPSKCTTKSNAYHIRFQNNAEGEYVYGMLAIPKAKGKYPTLLVVPGAGVRPYRADVNLADKGFVVLSIGIHGIPVNKSVSYYTNLANGDLKNYSSRGLNSKDTFYYKYVYAGCVKAVDFLCSLPSVDQEHIAINGGSQGGALAIVTASLDSRIKFLTARHPALSELVGYPNNTTSGWPHLFRYNTDENLKAQMQTTQYYDVVNFARQLNTPGYYTWGYNDRVCTPTSMFAVYNEIKAPKKLVLALDSAHWLYQEQINEINAYIIKNLQ